MKYIEENERIWDMRSENNDVRSIPVSSEMIRLAKEGQWSIVLTPQKPVPLSWFPENLAGKKILCLANGVGICFFACTKPINMFKQIRFDRGAKRVQNKIYALSSGQFGS